MPFSEANRPVAVPSGGVVEFIARADGQPFPRVSFSLVSALSSAGVLETTGPQTARFYASYSGFASAQLRVTSDAMSSLATTVELVGSGTRDLSVVPYFSSDWSIATNTRQTFSLVEYAYSTTRARGVANTEWYLWSNDLPNVAGRPVDGTVQLSEQGTNRVYARDPLSAQWEMMEVYVAPSNQPSIEVSPAVSTVAPAGVVQLTAYVSTGVGVQWDVIVPGTGSINASGTYTAPFTPGIYVVQATPLGGNGSRFAVATIIVQ
jgi:hypothetical protein